MHINKYTYEYSLHRSSTIKLSLHICSISCISSSCKDIVKSLAYAGQDKLYIIWPNEQKPTAVKYLELFYTGGFSESYLEQQLHPQFDRHFPLQI